MLNKTIVKIICLYVKLAILSPTLHFIDNIGSSSQIIG